MIILLVHAYCTCIQILPFLIIYHQSFDFIRIQLSIPTPNCPLTNIKYFCYTTVNTIGGGAVFDCVLFRGEQLCARRIWAQIRQVYYYYSHV